MRTIETEIFTFDELSEEAQENAIEKVRNSYYENNDFAQWAIDDCSLLEPYDKELRDLFGKDYKFPLIKNNRKVYFSLDNRYIDISNAMEITNDKQFLMWLGIDEDLIEDVYFTIEADTIEFQTSDYDYEFTDEEEKVLEEAKEKFEEHCHEILNRIEENVNYRFTDGAIKEDIEANNFEFLENGKLI